MSTFSCTARKSLLSHKQLPKRLVSSRGFVSTPTPQTPSASSGRANSFAYEQPRLMSADGVDASTLVDLDKVVELQATGLRKGSPEYRKFIKVGSVVGGRRGRRGIETLPASTGEIRAARLVTSQSICGFSTILGKHSNRPKPFIDINRGYEGFGISV
ncbi:hypothetical protein QFC22_006216 [Naganishia vaughanmartiniae]|uniref:Uncharacterized protein n=1 Tax=Naganishia vaughanmartiniae TaxID=1424756 RepID=A0ACC2WND4_9TREE|nr:hypothetical protein QFC22_006216 [Naganishia vaughanmartiniae]